MPANSWCRWKSLIVIAFQILFTVPVVCLFAGPAPAAQDRPPAGENAVTVPAEASEEPSASTVLPRLVTQLGHTSRINEVVSSRNGRLIATLESNAVHLWDAENAKELWRSNSADINFLQHLLFAPDEQSLVTGGSDGTIRFWDVATGRIVRSIVSPDFRFNGALEGPLQVGPFCYSLDGARLADVEHVVNFSTSGNVIRVWDAASGQESSPPVRLLGEIHSIIFQGDDVVCAVQKDESIQVWNVNDLLCQHTFLTGTQLINSATFSQDGQFLIAACGATGLQFENGAGLFPRSNSDCAILWNLQTGLEQGRYLGHSSGVLNAAISANNELIVTSGNDESIRFWSVESGALLSTRLLPSGLPKNNNSSRLLSLSDDGLRVFCELSHGSLNILETATGTLLREFKNMAVPIRHSVFSPDGKRIITSGNSNQHGTESTGRVLSWDLESSKQSWIFRDQSSVTALSYSANSGDVFIGGEGHFGVVSAVSGQVKRRIAFEGSFPPHVRAFRSTHDGIHIGLWGQPTIEKWDLSTQSRQSHFEVNGNTSFLSFSPNARQVLTGGVEPVARIYDVNTGQETAALAGHRDYVMCGDFSPDGFLVVTGGSDSSTRIWDADSGRQLHQFSAYPLTETEIGIGGRIVQSLAFSPNGLLVATGGADHTIRIWDWKAEQETAKMEGHADAVESVSFSSDGNLVLSGSPDGTVRLWSMEKRAEVCQLLSFRDDSWAVVAPDGRFDTNNLETMASLHWIFPDEPFRPLAPEVFLRQFYEPRLLYRLLHDEEFQEILPLADLNRVQPQIAIHDASEGSTADIINVVSVVTGGSSVFHRQNLDITVSTDVYDFRLFRDGQLVSQWPEPPVGQDAEFEPDPTSTSDMQKWRNLNRVAADGTRVTALPDGKMSITFPVRLPHRDAAGSVEFTAYAFNEDRVKSETARFTFEAPANPATTKPRAYLIGMGVSVSENTNWNLNFAANDARLTVEEFSKSLRQYEVVPVLLTSETGNAPPTATRGNLRTILQRLGGHNALEADTTPLPNVDKLPKVTPDDLVLIAFSGHGYTDVRGVLHLLPYDVGAGQEEFEKVLPHCISSGDLAAWLKDIDAGELVLILDACHSASAGAPPGFKPGPLGGRGLAQLAYDKGMRVLAASQADDVALESEKIQHGLLTYALIRDGLQARRASPDDELTLGRLMAYSADRVPVLYEEVLRGEVKAVQGRQVEPIEPKDSERSRAQRPELFDYGTRRQEISLHLTN